MNSFSISLTSPVYYNELTTRTQPARGADTMLGLIRRRRPIISQWTPMALSLNTERWPTVCDAGPTLLDEYLVARWFVVMIAGRDRNAMFLIRQLTTPSCHQRDSKLHQRDRNAVRGWIAQDVSLHGYKIRLVVSTTGMYEWINEWMNGILCHLRAHIIW